jgi:hypothetical protein
MFKSDLPTCNHCEKLIINRDTPYGWEYRCKENNFLLRITPPYGINMINVPEWCPLEKK